MKKNCCTCLAKVEEENASILTMGAYGTPKYLCEDCAALIETITLGREYDEIADAMEQLTKTMSKANIDDRFTVSTVTDLLASAAERARKIKDGTYDFALDESEEEFLEIPEEIRETEEDKLLDKKDAEAAEKFDKILNWAWLICGIAALGYFAYYIITRWII